MRRIVRAVPLLAAVAFALGTITAGVAQSPSVPASPGPTAQDSAVIVQLRGADGAPLTPEDRATAQAVIETRLAAMPAPAPHVLALPEDRLRIDDEDPSRVDAIRRVATAPGVFTFVPITGGGEDVIDGQPLPEGVAGAPIVTNDGIESLAPGSDQLGSPAVDIQLSPDAADAFDAWAAEHLGERIAMVLDGIVLSAPTINAPEFRGQAQISGSLDADAVAELAAILSGGVLPVVAEAVAVCPAAGNCPITSPVPGSSVAP